MKVVYCIHQNLMEDLRKINAKKMTWNDNAAAFPENMFAASSIVYQNTA